MIPTDRQVAFEHVARHLLKQNARSWDGTMKGTMCAYRGQCGRACAVGCLIADNDYRPAIEGKSVAHRDVIAALYECPLTLTDLIHLQSLHDNNSPGDWRQRLVDFAKEFGFTWPEGL